MKAILDEGVPRKLISFLQERGCAVVPFPNDWKGMRNGSLLDCLERLGFDCLITCDKNMRWQQSLRTRRVAVVILPVQKLSALRSIAEEIARAVKSARPGEIGYVKFHSDKGKER